MTDNCGEVLEQKLFFAYICEKVEILNSAIFLQQILTSNLQEFSVGQLKARGKDLLNECLTTYVSVELCAVEFSD